MKKALFLLLVLLVLSFLSVLPITKVYAADSITFVPANPASPWSTSGTVTVEGYSEAEPANLTKIYNADLAGTLELLANTSIAPESETLRPDGNGTYQEWETVVPSGYDHWNVTQDDNDGTYFSTTGSSSKRDIQNITNPTLATIASVEISVRLNTNGSGAKEKAYIMDKLGGSERLSSTGNLIRNTWTDYSTGTLTTNPAGGNWTVQNITDLEVGVQVQTLGAGEGMGCSEIWVLVTAESLILNLTRQVQPADSGALKLNLTISAFNSAGTVTFTGLDSVDDSQTEDVSISGSGNVVTTRSWKSIDDNGISATGNYSMKIDQSRWGVIWKKEDSFTVNARINVGVDFGSTETWFAEEDSQIFYPNTAVMPLFNVIDNYGFSAENHFRLGRLLDADLKLGNHGVQIMTDKASIHTLLDMRGTTDQIYATNIIALNGSARVYAHHDITFYQNTFSNTEFFIQSGASDEVNIYRFTSYDLPSSGYGLFYASTASQTIEDLLLHSNVYATVMALYGSSVSVTLKDATFRNNTYIASIQIFEGNYYLVDPDYDTWNLEFYPSQDGKVWEQYTFKINVTDDTGSPVQNANVTVSHYGENSGVDFTVLTGSNGSFATQTLTKGFYNQTGGNTTYDYNPYNITITHPNFARKSYNRTINEPVKEVISLEQSPTSTVSTTTYMMLGALLFSPIMLAIALSRRNKAKR